MLPNPKSELLGFSPDELKNHFSKVSFSDTENLLQLSDIITSASDDGFKFYEVSLTIEPPEVSLSNFNDIVVCWTTLKVKKYEYIFIGGKPL